MMLYWRTELLVLRALVAVSDYLPRPLAIRVLCGTMRRIRLRTGGQVSDANRSAMAQTLGVCIEFEAQR